MKKDLLDEIITRITKIFRKCYNKLMEIFGVKPSPLYSTTVILVDKTFVNTDFKMDVLKLFVRKKTNQDCMYDLSKYKYIHSLNKIRNSYIEDSLFPQNFYEDVLKNKHKYGYSNVSANLNIGKRIYSKNKWHRFYLKLWFTPL